MPRPSPFMLHCWLLQWWRFYGEGCRLAVETAYRGGRLVGALPLVTFSHHGLRVATFVGARQSCLGDVLLAEGEGPELVEALVDRAQGRVAVELTTAYELSDDEASSIVSQIEQASGRTVEATRAVDPDLIGGLILQAGSLRVDASVRGRLQKLRRELVTTS